MLVAHSKDGSTAIKYTRAQNRRMEEEMCRWDLLTHWMPDFSEVEKEKDDIERETKVLRLRRVAVSAMLLCM